MLKKNLLLSISNEKPKSVVSFGNFDSMTMSKHRTILSSQLQEYREDNLSVFVEHYDPAEEKTIKWLFWNK